MLPPLQANQQTEQISKYQYVPIFTHPYFQVSYLGYYFGAQHLLWTLFLILHISVKAAMESIDIHGYPYPWHPDSEIVMVDGKFWDDSFEQDRSWDDFGTTILGI